MWFSGCVYKFYITRGLTSCGIWMDMTNCLGFLFVFMAALMGEVPTVVVFNASIFCTLAVSPGSCSGFVWARQTMILVWFYSIIWKQWKDLKVKVTYNTYSTHEKAMLQGVLQLFGWTGGRSTPKWQPFIMPCVKQALMIILGPEVYVLEHHQLILYVNLDHLYLSYNASFHIQRIEGFWSMLCRHKTGWWITALKVHCVI